MTQKPTRPPTPTPRSARRTSPPRWRGDILRAGFPETAGEFLRLAAPQPDSRGRLPTPDFDWESAWINFLEAAGRAEEAQAVRWASFERTLTAARARDYIARLPDFEDVEAEHRAFALAARHQDANRGLAFLLDWPALREAADMIEARAEALTPSPEGVELWAARLRRRYPKAAHRLLRLGAARAFRSREYKLCDRLTEEAEAILNVDADDGRRPSGGG